MKKINKKYFIVILIILFISIGFAYLSATLNVTGFTRVMGNNWNIYFNNIQYVRGQSFETIAPTTTGTTTTSVSYQVFLPSPGDVYKFNIDIVNGGSLDAMVKVVTDTDLTAQQKQYASYYVTYSDGISVDDYQLLPKNSTDTLSVMVAYNKDIDEANMPSTDQSINITFHLEYEQATSNATSRNHITVVNRQTNGQLSVGDEIALGDEHFHIVSTNDEKTVLLSKYNLNVGNNTQEGTIGIQNSACMGWNWGTGAVDGNSPCTLAYSTKDYWMDSNKNLKIQYGKIPYDNDIYDANYNSSSGNNYSIAYHVINYTNYLSNNSLKIIKGRLLSYKELASLGCNPIKSTSFTSTSYNSFAYYTSYWCSAVGNSNSYLLSVIKGGNCGINDYRWGNDRGVRPVIEIPALDI